MNIFQIRRMVTVAFLLVAPLCATGCYDRQELEQQAFVTILGIDAAPGGLVDCTLRIALPTNPASAGGGGAKTPLAGALPVTYRAHSLNEAMLIASSSVERTITFTHLTNIVFGKKVAERGILPYIRPMVRFREFRRTTLFSVSDTTAREVITKERPMVESSTGRMADSIAMVGSRTGLYPIARIHDLLSSIENPNEDVIAPVFGVNPVVESDPKAQNGIQENGVDYRAGQVHTVGGNPVEVSGAAIFHGDRMVDYLDGRGCILLNMLRRGVRTTKYDFVDPIQKEQNISVIMRRERSPNYQISLKSQPIRISIDLPIDVDITNIGSGTDYANPVMQAKLENSLSQQLGASLTKLLQKIEVKDGSDCIPISQHVRGRFGTYQSFANFPWRERMKSADIKVNAKVHIRRFGVQTEPLQPEF